MTKGKGLRFTAKHLMNVSQVMVDGIIYTYKRIDTSTDPTKKKLKCVWVADGSNEFLITGELVNIIDRVKKYTILKFEVAK